MSDPYIVYAVSDRVARIRFSDTFWSGASPRHVSSTGELDALNPRTWTIWVPETGRLLTCMSVLAVDAYTYDILTLEHFEPWNGPQMQLQTEGVIMDTDPYTVLNILGYDFNGAIQRANATPTSQAVRKGVLPTDLANVPVAVDPLIGGPYIVGGTLVINSAGDYATMSGEALVKKLILRRLISKKGDFFHLPQYGAGLGVKETYSRNNLSILAKDIEQQVLQEPEVERAKASVSYMASAGALVIQVRARIRSTGQETALSMNLPIGSVQL